MFVPIILGSDKTTVSVAMGHTEAYCYNPPSFSFFSHPQMPTAPVIPQLMPPRAHTPPLPTTFTQAIQAIPITWPTHTCHHSSMEYFTEPTAPATDPTTESDGDSPMRDCSPSPRPTSSLCHHGKHGLVSHLHLPP